MEHMLKRMKRELRDHALKNNNKWQLVLLHLFQRKYGWFGDQDPTRQMTCNNCHEKGHMKTSKLCQLYEEGKGEITRGEEGRT